MDSSEAQRLEVVQLSSADIDEVFALHEVGRSLTPYGFLAPRSREDYGVLLGDPDSVIAAGVRDGGSLVAYSLCHRLAANPYPENPILSEIDVTSSIVYHGDGTIVHPEYQGRHLARRIFRLRQQQMAEREIDHMLGLVAVDNIVSIGNVLLSGAMLIGFREDETAMNFIAYGGRLGARVRQGEAPQSVDWRDRTRHKQLFDERRVVCDISRAAKPVNPSLGESASRDFRFFQFV